MAQAISVNELKQLSVMEYKTIREELRTGDIVFCSGSYVFSKLIQKFTKSVWSHVGIIYKDEQLNRILILESEKLYGVRLAPLSKYIKDYHGKNKPYKGNLAVCRVNKDLSNEDVKKIFGFGLDELTKPYDNLEILRIAARILFKKGRRTQDRKYICSELVYECFQRADISFHYKNKLISPDEIWKDERLNLLFRIL
jgi:Permuted papain-like amidase enzyme, YaeF/YiiX, C92 family